MTGERKAYRARIDGIVQGVGFRYSTAEAARKIGGLGGWVRNTKEGSVEVHVEGAEDRCLLMRAYLAKGPVTAKVESLLWEAATVQGFEEFVVRRD